jgi:hypothetical protein
MNYSSVPSVRTGTEPKRTEPNGSFFSPDFLGTEVCREPKNRTDRFWLEPNAHAYEPRPGLGPNQPTKPISARPHHALVALPAAPPPHGAFSLRVSPFYILSGARLPQPEKISPIPHPLSLQLATLITFRRPHPRRLLPSLANPSPAPPRDLPRESSHG